MTVDSEHATPGSHGDAGARTDNLLVVAVVVACVALLLGGVALGISAEAASRSRSKLRAAEAVLASASAVKPSGAPGAVSLTERDFAISSPVPTATGGLIDFTIHNAGPSEHEFLIFQTDAPPDKLPLGSDGRVDESSDAAHKVFDSGSNIGVGGTQVFHTALTPGHYVLVCNLPGHYLAGMHTALTVT